MKKRSYAVIGLGQFGTAVVDQLIENGQDVIAIDASEEAIQKVSQKLTTAFIADSTDEHSLMDLGISDVDTAIVAFGENEKATILTTVILKELGVPRVIVRVDNDYYAKIMLRLGADEIISPQKNAGTSLANRLRSMDFKDYYKLDRKYCVVSILVHKNFKPVTLSELRSKERFGVNILLVVHENGDSFVPGGNDQILPNDKVFVVGTSKEIASFREGINGKN